MSELFRRYRSKATIEFKEMLKEIDRLKKENKKARSLILDIENELRDANNQHLDSRHKWRYVLRVLSDCIKFRKELEGQE